MRFWFFALMIVLLPVRGWMGNAMAVDMAAQAAVQADKALSQGLAKKTQGSTAASMPADCPMSAQPANPASVSVDLSAPDTVHCNACDTCELCLALTTIRVFQLSLPPAQTCDATTAVRAGFASADRTVGLKPPIS